MFDDTPLPILCPADLDNGNFTVTVMDLISRGHEILSSRGWWDSNDDPIREVQYCGYMLGKCTNHEEAAVLATYHAVKVRDMAQSPETSAYDALEEFNECIFYGLAASGWTDAEAIRDRLRKRFVDEYKSEIAERAINPGTTEFKKHLRFALKELFESGKEPTRNEVLDLAYEKHKASGTPFAPPSHEYAYRHLIKPMAESEGLKFKQTRTSTRVRDH